MQTNIILQGDALTQLKTFQDNSIDCVMTSPPYWALRDYGTAKWEGGNPECNHVRDNKITENCDTGHKAMKELGVGDAIYKTICGKCGAARIDEQLGLETTFQEYINKLCDIFDEVKRVLKKEGTCWVNIGDTYGTVSGGMNQLRKMGKDTPQYGSVRYADGYEGVKQDRKKNMNMDKCLIMIPFRFAIEMVNRGWILRNTIIWHKPNCMPSSVKDRFTVDFEYIFFFTKSKKYFFETQYEPHKFDSIKRACRARTSNKLDCGQYSTSYKQRYSGYNNMMERLHNGEIRGVGANGRNKRAVWKITTKPFKEAHFATYPETLCETPLKAGCPIEGIVLDPFFGSGTTGLVALKQGKKFIGIELNPEYIKIAEGRLKQFLEQQQLKIEVSQ